MAGNEIGGGIYDSGIIILGLGDEFELSWTLSFDSNEGINGFLIG
jgi:hypothetical protein